VADFGESEQANLEEQYRVPDPIPDPQEMDCWKELVGGLALRISWLKKDSGVSFWSKAYKMALEVD